MVTYWFVFSATTFFLFKLLLPNLLIRSRLFCNSCVDFCCLISSLVYQVSFISSYMFLFSISWSCWSSASPSSDVNNLFNALIYSYCTSSILISVVFPDLATLELTAERELLMVRMFLSMRSYIFYGTWISSPSNISICF